MYKFIWLLIYFCWRSVVRSASQLSDDIVSCCSLKIWLYHCLHPSVSDIIRPSSSSDKIDPTSCFRLRSGKLANTYMYRRQLCLTSTSVQIEFTESELWRPYSKTSVVSNRIRVNSCIRTVLHVNTHRLTESDSRFDVTLSRWRP